MLRNIRKRITAQSTAEFAIMLALVIGAVVAMQVYVRRALQARIQGATTYMASTINQFGVDPQYEPYYLQDSDYETSQDAYIARSGGTVAASSRLDSVTTGTRVGNETIGSTQYMSE